MKKRIFYALGTMLIFLIELLIALYVRDQWIRPYAGDILAVILVYFGLKTLWPSFEKAAAVAFLVGAAIEMAQGIHILKHLGLENNRYLRIILGSTFDWQDLACYFIGMLIILFVEKYLTKRNLTRM